MSRYDDASDTELFSQPRCMQWSCAAESDDVPLRKIHAELGSVSPRSCRHVFIDHFTDGVGCVVGTERLLIAQLGNHLF